MAINIAIAGQDKCDIEGDRLLSSIDVEAGKLIALAEGIEAGRENGSLKDYSGIEC